MLIFDYRGGDFIRSKMFSFSNIVFIYIISKVIVFNIKSSFSAVDVFNQDFISRSVLKKIIEHPGVIEDKEPGKENASVYLYKHGAHADFFALILQGRIEVTVGIENITFEDGPFSVFGVNALLCESGQQFLPDYAVKVISHIQYLKVSRSLYRSAVRASKMEKENKTPDNYQEYDEIFWNHMKKIDGGEEGHVIDIGSSKSDRSSLRSGGSMRSNDNDGGTPSKMPHKRKTSLLNKLTPKFDRKRNSPTPDGTAGTSKRKDRNQLSISSLENPLMSSTEETGELLVDTSSVSPDAPV